MSACLEGAVSFCAMSMGSIIHGTGDALVGIAHLLNKVGHCNDKDLADLHEKRRLREQLVEQLRAQNRVQIQEHVAQVIRKNHQVNPVTVKPEVVTEMILSEPELVVSTLWDSLRIKNGNTQTPIQYSVSTVKRMHKTYVAASLQCAAEGKGFKVKEKKKIVKEVPQTVMPEEPLEETIHLEMENPATGEQLEVIVHPDGNFFAEVHNHKGPECQKIVAGILQGLDVTITNRRNTPEFYQKVTPHVQQQVGR